MKNSEKSTWCMHCAYSKHSKVSLWCLLHKDYYFSVESTCNNYMNKSKKVTFGVLNPHTKEIITVATTLFGGILWLNELAKIFENDTPVVIIEGESDVKTIGDLKDLENNPTIFLP